MTHAPVILYHDILSFFKINNKRTAFALKLATSLVSGGPSAERARGTCWNLDLLLYIDSVDDFRRHGCIGYSGCTSMQQCGELVRRGIWSAV